MHKLGSLLDTTKPPKPKGLLSLPHPMRPHLPVSEHWSRPVCLPTAFSALPTHSFTRSPPVHNASQPSCDVAVKEQPVEWGLQGLSGCG